MQQTELKKSSSSLENNPNKIQQLWLMQNEIKQKFQKEKINEKSIVLVGDTNVGKTTLLYYLSGKKLNLVQNTAKKTKQIQPQVIYLDAKVSNSLSTTQVPNIFSQISDLLQLSLIDMPGLNDKRFMNVLSNMFTFSEVFEKLSKTSKVHIAFVISQEMFDSQQIKENLQQFVSRFDVESIKKASNISIIFTKTQDDQQSVKQQFIEFLQQIKEELQDDEQQKEVREIVDILLQLYEGDNTFFIFPKEDPVQTHGLEVTQTILERNAFINVDQGLLHENFFGNLLENEKIKIASFQETLTEVINQSYEQISQFLDLSVDLTRILHKKISLEIFASETDFRTQLQNTFSKLQTYQKTSTTEEDKYDFSKFQESMIFICENISQNKEIFLLDRQIKELFTKLSSSYENSQFSEPQSSFAILMTQLLKNCFDKITKVVSNFKQAEILIQPLKRIINFLDWLSQKWYSKLNNVKSLDKISKLFSQNNQQLSKTISLKWKEISESNAFYDILNNFSQRALQSQGQSESSQEQPHFVQQKVQDNGYYGHTVRELKQRYTKVSQLPNLDDPKIQIQMILEQQRQLQQKVKKVVYILESQVITQVKQAEKSEKYKITINPQRVAFILFQMRKLRHRIFLQSAIKNFSYYLKFIYYSLVSESEKEKLMEILTGFVDNLCIILDQYSLFQEEILLIIFVQGYSKIGKVFERGIRTGRIGQQFIRKQLIPHLKMLIQGTQCVKDLEQLSNIIITTFNYLISQHSASRSQSNQYKIEMDSMLRKLQQKINSVSKTESNMSTHGTELKSNKSLLLTKQPNYFVLMNNPSFDFSTIAQKVDILQKRNVSLQTYQIYYNFHQQSTAKSHKYVNYYQLKIKQYWASKQLSK